MKTLYNITIMRRILPLVSFVTLSLLLFGACVSAPKAESGVVVYSFPELKMKISLPASYCVITRDRVTHPELLEERGIKIKAAQASFVQSGIFLNAMPESFEHEYVLTSFENEGSNEVGDFSLYTGEELADLITPEGMVEEYRTMGIEARTEPVEKINGKVYFILNFTQPGETGGFIYIRQYFTIVNGVAIQFVYNKFSGSINDEEKLKQRVMIESIVFNKS